MRTCLHSVYFTHYTFMLFYLLYLNIGISFGYSVYVCITYGINMILEENSMKFQCQQLTYSDKYRGIKCIWSTFGILTMKHKIYNELFKKDWYFMGALKCFKKDHIKRLEGGNIEGKPRL